jgi:RHS repeat-associated protein
MQKTRMPDLGGNQQWSTSRTGYDELGRRSRVNVPIYRPGSSWESLPATYGTVFQYDRFDRPTLVQQPDSHTTLIAYQGSRQVSRTVAAATDSRPDGTPLESDAVTTERYDGYGRLLSVTEGSGTNGADVTTSYGYDVGNRLDSVTTTDSPVTQTRTFTYDQRGFLLSEQHPESGQTLYGAAISAPAYDARGHATRKVVASQDLRFTYDSAERLTTVQAGNPNGTLSTLKSFTYGEGNLGTCPALSGCEARNGKLVTAVRHNLDPLFGDVTVTESYAYYGRGGRLAERNTTVSSGGGFEGASFVTRRSWNELGLLDTVAYPETSFAGQPRYVGYGYDQGILSAVNGYGTVTYQPSGVVAAVAHANGVSEVWDPDASGMARPARIRATSAGQTLWDSGSYAYDGIGNIATIGPRRFRYDKVGRLSFESNPYPEAFYSYDAFGNRTGSTIAHVHGDVFGRVTTIVPLDAQTNRLQGTALYDSAGNMTQWAVDDTFTYDATSIVTTHNAAGRTVHYLYTADDERIAEVERLTGADQQLHNKTTWTLRATENQLLRVFTDDATSGSRVWSWTEDEIWRGASLLANESAIGTRHYTVDHLGSPRLVTSASGTYLGTQEFSAFGEGGTTDGGAIQFTGHERDWSHGPAGWGETFDYMHARYYSPGAGRFLSVDPVLGSLQSPQSWNRYAYASNNPVMRTDSDGRVDLAKAYAAASLELEEIASKVDAAKQYLRIGGPGNPYYIVTDMASGALHDAADALKLGTSVGDLRHNADTSDILMAAAVEGGRAGKGALLLASVLAPLTMDSAVSKGAAHVDGTGVMESTGKNTNFQFRSTSIDAAGKTETRVARFDINPSDPHVQSQGPHLNLEIQVNGRVKANDHISIDPATVRPGDHP